MRSPLPPLREPFLRTILAPLAAAAWLSGAVQAQDLDVVFVSDSTVEGIWRLEDLDGDGTYHGPGETVLFYSDQVGSIPLSNNIGITRDAQGIVYVCDSTQNIVLALEDQDGDGHANSPGEHWVFFDGNPGGNAAGIWMVSAQEVYAAPDGKIWVASANTGAGGNDLIFYLQDLNGDGTANGVGEAVVYYQPPGSAVGDSIPQDIAFGPDGALYYLENGSTSLLAKGIYRLEDLDGSGAIDQPNEVTPFFIPPALGGTPFHWGFDVDEDGYFYLADTGNNVMWRARDANGDGVIDNATEAVQWWTSPVNSTIWMVSVGNDGWIYAAESAVPRRVLRMRDSDGDGVVDPASEVEVLYNRDLALELIGNPRSLFVARDLAVPGVASCFGDGSAAQCPCSNYGASGEGCSNSSGAGARLSGFGSTSASSDTLVLRVEGIVPGKPGLIFAGRSPTALPFADGLLCIDGPLQRMTVYFADPQGRFETGSIASSLGLSGGDLRLFQAWYRDVYPPCNSGSNLSNAYEVLFTN